MNGGQGKVIFGLVIILIAIVLTLSTLIITIMKLGERVDDLEQKINGEGFYSSSLYIKGGDETIEALRKDFAADLNVKMTITITENQESSFDYNVPATGTRLGRYVLVKEEAVKDYSSLLFQDLYFDVYLGLAAVAETKVYYGSYELAPLMDKGGWMLFQLPEGADIPEIASDWGDPAELALLDILVSVGYLVLPDDKSITPVSSPGVFSSNQLPEAVNGMSGAFLLAYPVFASPGSPVFGLDNDGKPYLVAIVKNPVIAVKITKIFDMAQEEGIDLRNEFQNHR